MLQQNTHWSNLEWSLSKKTSNNVMNQKNTEKHRCSPATFQSDFVRQPNMYWLHQQCHLWSLPGLLAKQVRQCHLGTIRWLRSKKCHNKKKISLTPVVLLPLPWRNTHLGFINTQAPRRSNQHCFSTAPSVFSRWKWGKVERTSGRKFRGPTLIIWTTYNSKTTSAS